MTFGEPPAGEAHHHRRPKRLRHLPRSPRRTAWEVVWQGDSEALAHIVGGSLNASGIRARLAATGPRYLVPGAAGTNLGSWQLMVAESQATEARELLEERHETAGIVRGDGAGLGADRVATIWFMVFGLVIVAIIAAVQITLR